MKKQKPKRRNNAAASLRAPQFQPQKVPNKKRKLDKRRCRQPHE